MKLRQFFYFIALAVHHSSFAITMQTDVDTKVKKESMPEQTLKAGESFEILPGEVVLAIPKESLPVMILHPNHKKTTLQMSSFDLKDYTNIFINELLNRQTNEIITGLRKAESALSQRDYTQAANILNPLKSKYPQISSLLFLSASVDYLLKNKTAAIESLEKGLLLEPEDANAKKLLAELRGQK